jgi:predicted XRE-type DNA-binding protein
MIGRKNEVSAAITPSSGNVFADLGFADADERQTKVRLALAINRILEQRRLSQTQAAQRLGINQPKISALARYRLEGFSVERLVHFLNALGRDVEIVIRNKPASRKAARIIVTAVIGNHTDSPLEKS